MRTMPQSVLGTPVALYIGCNARPLPDTYETFDVSTSASFGGIVSLLRVTLNGKEFGCRKVKKSSKPSRRERLYQVRFAHLCVRFLTGQRCLYYLAALFARIDFALQSIENHVRVSRHPNVLAAHEAYEDSKYVYIITEFCDETAWSSQRAADMAEDEVARWGLQVIEALAHCHQHGKLSSSWYMQEYMLAIA